MKEILQTIWVVSALGLFACGDNTGFEDRDTTQPPKPPQASLTVATTWDSATAGTHQTSFQFGEVTDLVFAAKVPGQETGTSATLDLYSPTGVILTRYKIKVSKEAAIFVVPVDGAILGKKRLVGSYAARVRVEGKDIVDGVFEFKQATRVNVGTENATISLGGATL